MPLDATAIAPAEVLHRASTVDIQNLPTMIGEAFDLIGSIIRLVRTVAGLRRLSLTNSACHDRQ